MARLAPRRTLEGRLGSVEKHASSLFLNDKTQNRFEELNNYSGGLASGFATQNG
jgi:hypothetical protein